MTIFSILNSILYSKKPLDVNVDDENIFNLYMVNRWCSMHSPEINNLINDTTNRLGMVLESKEDQVKFLTNILPRCRFKRIEYLKKTKKEKLDKDQETRDQYITLIAKTREISKREVLQAIQEGI
jgi:hypothetical protein